ncbi:hypothetical protein D9M72_357080 [compost metagenome]
MHITFGAGGFPVKYPLEGRFPYGINGIDVLAYCLDEGLVFRFIVRDRVILRLPQLDKNVIEKQRINQVEHGSSQVVRLHNPFLDSCICLCVGERLLSLDDLTTTAWIERGSARSSGLAQSPFRHMEDSLPCPNNRQP